MDPLSISATIISILETSLTVVDYINSVKDASKERILLRDEINTTSGLLYMLRDRIQREQQRTAKKSDNTYGAWTASVLALGTPRGPLEQIRTVLNELDHKVGKPENQGSTLKMFGKSLAWPFHKPEIERYVSVLERQKSLFQLALQNDNIGLMEAIADDIKSIQDGTKFIPGLAWDVAVVAAKMSEMTVNDRYLQNQAIMDWVSPLNFFQTHDSILARRTPGTGQWILDCPEYRSWLEGTGATIWCPGIPGAGKTVLSSIIVDDLRGRFESNSNIGVAAVYCNYKERQDQTPVRLLAAIWFQLVNGNNNLNEEVEKLYQKHHGRNTNPTSAEIEILLVEELARYQKVFIIIDAFDESYWLSRMDFLESVRALQPKVNLLVTSRFDDSIACAFENCPTVEINANSQDLGAYVSSRISGQLLKHTTRDPTLAQDINDMVVGRAQNMFLLARLQLDSLQDRTSPKAVRKALATLPRDLDTMYEETLARIDNQSQGYRSLAKDVIQWIVFAVRPLSINEIQEALAVEEDTDELDESNEVEAELLTSVCAGLVVLDRAGDVMRLVHFSTQEYLKRILSPQAAAAHAHIGKTCLAYLSFREYGDLTWHDRLDIETRKHRLLRYAARHWGQHIQAASDIDMETEVLRFLDDKSKVASTSLAMHVTAPTKFPRSLTKMHLVAHFGLEKPLKTLLQLVDDVSAPDAFGATPLHSAADAGQASAVSILLDHGADIEAADLEGHTPLHKAAISASREVVLLLLQRGARISKAIDGRTPLHFACENPDKDIVSALLAAGANVNEESHDGGDYWWQKKFLARRTPLHWAAFNGHLAVAKELVKHGATVNAVNSTNRTPLQEAIMAANVPVVRFLLDNGASLTIRDSCGWTPLHEAANQSPVEVTRLLLERGAEIDAVTIDFTIEESRRRAEDEHQRIFEGMVVPVSELEEAGIRLEPDHEFVRCDTGCTPLIIAVIRGEVEIFELLKSHGAAIDFVEGEGMMPLHRTVLTGNPDDALRIVQSLLNSGVDVDVREAKRQETTLHLAARMGRLDLAMFLIQRGASKEALNCFGETPLQLAQSMGHTGIVKLLTG